MKQSINSPYIQSILINKLKFEKYPNTLVGILAFLRTCGIDIFITTEDGNWTWVGADLTNETNIFSEDFTEYDTFDDALEAALVESICYLSLSYEKERKY